MANTRTARKATNSRATARREENESPMADEVELAADMIDYLREYARAKPEVAALWCLGIGFVLGWKLKPW